jgi:hypothetical protein
MGRVPEKMHWASAVPEASQVAADNRADNRKDPTIRPGRDFEPLIVGLPLQEP